MRYVYIVSFFFALCWAALTSYSWYSYVSRTWQVAPADFILLSVSIGLMVLGMPDTIRKGRGWSKARALVTLSLSLLMCFALTAEMLFTSMFSFREATHIKTVESPDGAYGLDIYSWDAGAAGSFGISAHQNGPLWFTKPVYSETDARQAEVQWQEDGHVAINGSRLLLGE
ncbi:DUF5412 family protein [Salibacterium halotolerans]|uniref:Uncharacterized protein n=1 Tax=Salibacterium halotolerans TaxID=1884432 RepID=A0A1I5S6J7_9BACI|nr:DUF5412 family protein [Salibacterium halotolerans]SFP66291.1 hypothetical protein SAMN05518683_10867 [Salibacterium halotolerans]